MLLAVVPKFLHMRFRKPLKNDVFMLYAYFFKTNLFNVHGILLLYFYLITIGVTHIQKFYDEILILIYGISTPSYSINIPKRKIKIATTVLKIFLGMIFNIFIPNKVPMITPIIAKTMDAHAFVISLY